MLVTMFYLEIKKGKEAIKASEFLQDIGGKTACINIILKAIKGCGKL